MRKVAVNSRSHEAPCLLWFRHDLRLSDNPALAAALAQRGPIIPVFIWAPDEEAPWAPGAASSWWLHHSLHSLGKSLRAAGSRLILRQGYSCEELLKLARQAGATSVWWNRRYEPVVIRRDAAIEARLKEAGLVCGTFNAALLHEPWTICNKAGKPFQVFTPFWKHCLSLVEPDQPLVPATEVTAPRRWPASLELDDFRLLPRADWAVGLRETWDPGEAGAGEQLRRFMRGAVREYSTARNRPDLRGTSQLSPHLHFGEISPRQVWHALRRSAMPGWRESQFLAEIGWREFSHHLLFHFPHTDAHPLRKEFESFRWRNNCEGLEAWKRGRTGFPIIDAGMQQLWHTGWMHNRVRMIVASFLVKDLLVHWQEGARWFWDTLVDADLAQNTLGWQWTAGCGADAAPFFRVFNPTTQGEKFDPEGDYVRRWVPELAGLPKEWIHKPHEAPAEVLEKASVRLDADYPRPIVNHAIAREVALETYRRL